MLDTLLNRYLEIGNIRPIWFTDPPLPIVEELQKQSHCKLELFAETGNKKRGYDKFLNSEISAHSALDIKAENDA